MRSASGSTASAAVVNWPAVLRRAAGAPQLLQPGLLASAIPGHGAYAGILGQDTLDGVLAADRTGRLAAVSLGSARTLPARIASLLTRHRLLVADLPAGAQGYAQLRALAAARPPGELLIVLQRTRQVAGHELLWAALAGLGGGRTLTSQTTAQQGLIAATDLAPTILRHLRLPIPADVRGFPVRTDGAFDGPRLSGLMARLLLIDSRRLPALAWLLLASGALIALGWGVDAFRPGGGDGAGARSARRAAMRVGGLAILWAPLAVMVTAALEPSPVVEYATIAALCLLLGALCDRLIPWPRAPLAPAIAVLGALTIDALAGTQLFIRSLLGPNPALGVRFHGIGNELKSGLAVLVLCAVAAALHPAVRSPRAALTMALAGIALAVLEGSALIGAAVGGVILVSAGTAVASLMLLPGALTRRRALIVLASPLLGLLLLAVLDLTLAHGGGHFTGSILHARSAGDLRDVLVRRYRAAWDELGNGAMPFVTGLALLAAVLAVRRRERLLAPVQGDPAWLAALGGGLTAGVVGALTEDSGPV
ncbi:MAG TPA: hypothetical protein VGX16_07130, partial [Solirubrobacteraceae bacterium]|nr:hypothetical protein [Solirubrobacteraceae bacterium]